MAKAFLSRTDRPPHRAILLRTGEILGQVAAHGFGSLLDRGEHNRRRRGAGPGVPVTDGRWARVRLLLEALGPTFVKMGQMFSNRPDLLPEELLVELRKLQDRVPGFSFELVKEALEEQYGRPLDEVFASFDPVPVASASVAQVHAARLADGRRVAVKVLRPGIEEVVATDLEILGHVGTWFERLILRSDALDARAIVREFSRNLMKELDFRQEAVYLERFGALFRDDPDCLVPRVTGPSRGPGSLSWTSSKASIPSIGPGTPARGSTVGPWPNAASSCCSSRSSSTASFTPTPIPATCSFFPTGGSASSTSA